MAATTKAAMHRVAELKDEGLTASHAEELMGLLEHPSNHVVAKAVSLAAAWSLEEAVPQFVRAFDRFMVDPLESDKGCDGKLAIVKALIAMEDHHPAIYWRGIRYRQMEPVWDRKREDTAPPLRAACAQGLALMNHERIYIALAELVLDPERVAREGAITTLKWLATPKAELVLHMKGVAGDAEPVVMGECFSALMTHWPEDSFELVAEHLGDDPEVTEQAALALAESRHAQTLERLTTIYDESLSDVKRVMLLPIALLRSDEAFEWLLTTFETLSTDLLDAGAEALAIFEETPERSARIAELRAARGI